MLQVTVFPCSKRGQMLLFPNFFILEIFRMHKSSEKRIMSVCALQL